MPNLVFFLSGLLAVIGQTLLLREMLVLFQGNELVLGLLLSFWLVGGAAGSWLAGRARGGRLRSGLARAFAGAGLGLAFGFGLVRFGRPLLGLLPGLGVPMAATLLIAGLVFLPPSFCFGRQFGLAVRWNQAFFRSRPAASVYFWEALGYLSGGLFYTFLLLERLEPVRIISLLLAACFTVSLFLSGLSRRLRRAGLFLTVLLLAAGFRPGLEAHLLQAACPGFQLRGVANSPYGQLLSVSREGQESWFYNGLPLTHPDPARQEELGLLPWLLHPSGRVLFLRGLDSLPELPGTEIVQLIGDRGLYDLFGRAGGSSPYRDFTSRPGEVSARSLPAVRDFLRRDRGSYGLIIFDLTAPLTLAQNRYFTREFFSLLSERLAPGGLVAISLPGSLVHYGPELTELNRVLYSTLAGVFGRVRVLPGDQENLFLAGPPDLDWEIGRVLGRFRALERPTRYLSDGYLAYRLDPARLAWFQDQVLAGPAAPPNLDFQPRLLLAGLRYWQSFFTPATGRLYRRLVDYTGLLWLLPLLWLAAGRRPGPAGSLFSSGFAGLSLQMLILWAFQVRYAALYQWLGLLSALFMAGLALGSFAGRRLAGFLSSAAAFRWLESAFLLWLGLAWLLFHLQFLSRPALFLLTAGSGFLVGGQFPIGVACLAAGGPEGPPAGRLYAADLLGGWLAALLVGGLLIPAWGLEPVFLFLLALKLASWRGWAFGAAPALTPPAGLR